MTNTAPAPCDGSATIATPNPTGGYTYTTCTGCPHCVRPNRSDRMRARIEAAGSAFVGIPAASSDDLFGAA